MGGNVVRAINLIASIVGIFAAVKLSIPVESMQEWWKKLDPWAVLLVVSVIVWVVTLWRINLSMIGDIARLKESVQKIIHKLSYFENKQF